MAEINHNQPAIDPTGRRPIDRGQLPDQPNVIERLQQRIRDAKGMGFRVRNEWLADQQATWCEIGGVKTIFIDLSQTAAEQLEQLEESLASLAEQRAAERRVAKEAAPQQAA